LYGTPEDPEVRRKVLKMLDDAVVEDIYGDVHQDEQNAELEHRAMVSSPGATLLPNAYDNHAVHMMTHRRLRKAREHQRLIHGDVKTGQVIEAALDQHESYHLAFIQEAQEEETKRLQAVK
jgi:hypothetical protein